MMEWRLNIQVAAISWGIMFMPWCFPVKARNYVASENITQVMRTLSKCCPILRVAQEMQSLLLYRGEVDSEMKGFVEVCSAHPYFLVRSHNETLHLPTVICHTLLTMARHPAWAPSLTPNLAHLVSPSFNMFCLTKSKGLPREHPPVCPNSPKPQMLQTIINTFHLKWTPDPSLPILP